MSVDTDNMFVSIENWKYMLSRMPDGRFRVWHHVMPVDAGYGTEVDEFFPADYFQNHSVGEFYGAIAKLQRFRSSPVFYDESREMNELTDLLREAGWIE